jgi:hypothetical protein
MDRQTCGKTAPTNCQKGGATERRAGVILPPEAGMQPGQTLPVLTDARGNAVSPTAPHGVDASAVSFQTDPGIDRRGAQSTREALVNLPIQRSTREALLSGMCGIIRRMTRVAPTGALCLVDHDERELAVALFAYLEGREP